MAAVITEAPDDPRAVIVPPAWALPMLKSFVNGEGALEPGFHPGLPLSRYLMAPAVSNTLMAAMFDGDTDVPVRSLQSLLEKKEPTAALVEGDAIHAAVLEPDRFKSDYRVAGQCEATKKDGKRCENPGKHLDKFLGWLCGTHVKQSDPGDLVKMEKVIDEDTSAMCLKIRDSVLVRHRRARALLTRRGRAELTGSCRDRETGLMQKIRADFLPDDLSVNVDLKSTLDASRVAFSKSIYKFGYFLQQGHYNYGLELLENPVRSHVLIAVEKEPPYLVAVYELDPDVVWAGRELARQLRRKLLECLEANAWPAFPDRVQRIGIPGWGWKQLRARGIDPDMLASQGPNGPAIDGGSLF